MPGCFGGGLGLKTGEWTYQNIHIELHQKLLCHVLGGWTSVFHPFSRFRSGPCWGWYFEPWPFRRTYIIYLLLPKCKHMQAAIRSVLQYSMWVSWNGDPQTIGFNTRMVQFWMIWGTRILGNFRIEETDGWQPWCEWRNTWLFSGGHQATNPSEFSANPMVAVLFPKVAASLIIL